MSRPIAAASTQTSVLQKNSINKPSGGSEHSTTSADQLLLSAHTHVCFRSSPLRVALKGQRLADQLLLVGIHMCVSEHTCLVQSKSLEALTI